MSVFLGTQTDVPVGFVSFNDVNAGKDRILRRFSDLAAAGTKMVIVDALTDDHLRAIGQACAGLVLITGGSGVAMELPVNFRNDGLLRESADAGAAPAVAGAEAVLSGRCSPATLGQVAKMAARCPMFEIDPLEIANGRNVITEALDWASEHLGRERILITASGTPESVSAVQDRLGVAVAGEMVENTLSQIAVGLEERGVRRMVVAGGETSGAIVSALGIKGLRIGQEISPGVPCTVSLNEPRIALSLKSGNFGGPNFFNEALDAMP